MDLQTIPEIIRAARARLPGTLWDLASGGAESETTIRRNRLAMETWAFRPRILRGVAHPDLRTTFLGHELASPVMLAPVGTIASFHRDGALAPARAAARRGTMSIVGVLAWPRLEEVTSTGALLALQVYVRGDRAWLKDLAQRAEGSGYAALCLTADSSGRARRERDLHNRFPTRQAMPSPNLPPDQQENDEPGRAFQARFCWDDFDWLRSVTRLPIMIKGILTPEDAALAVEHGANAIYVSNHGGRELDHNPATIEVLEEIVAAVAGRAEVVVDGGFLHGTDVVKALALGARAVLVGRLQLWGLAADGEHGLERTLEILDEEVAHALQLLGVARVADLSPAYVRPSLPTRAYPTGWNEYQYAPLPSL